MTKIVLFSVAAALASTLSLTAQNGDSLGKSLNEKELLSTIDSLGEGDPARKAPQSVGDSRSGGSRRDAKPAEEKKAKDVQGATEITAQEASFDQKAHQAVFAGDVRVKNPEFNITSDKLTAFLNDEAANEKAPRGEAGSTAPAAQTGNPAKKGGNSGGLKKVIAEGSVVITQDKVDADGKPNRSIGRGERAVYDSATGDVTLTGNPSLQQGINTIVATDPATVMILNREGRLKVIGTHRTVIQDAPENPKPIANGR